MGHRLAGHKDLLRQLFLGETMFFPQFAQYIFGRHTATSFFHILPRIEPCRTQFLLAFFIRGEYLASILRFGELTLREGD